MKHNDDQFIGAPFVWFTGVVEDIADPEEMGRVRVRCFGYHTDNKEEIPTEELPWACVVTPVTNPAMTGIGRSATGILQGTWVVGFFRDGQSAQDPLVLGSLPSRTIGPIADRGFFDPNGKYPHRSNEIDTPVQSTSNYKSAPSYIRRQDTRQQEIEKATAPYLSKTDTNAQKEDREAWSMKSADEVVRPAYPTCHTRETESGHVFETDDTPGAERLFRMHAGGTYEEIDNKSDRTLLVRGDNYEVYFKDQNVYVKGSVNLTIDGDVRHLVKGSYHLEVEGDYTQNIKGTSKIKIGGSEYREVSFDVSENIGKNFYTHVGKDQAELIDGSRTVVIGVDRDQTVKGTDKEYVLKSRTHYVAENMTTTIGSNSTHDTMGDSKVGVAGDLETTIVGDAAIAIGGAETLTISGDQTIGVRGSLSEEVVGSVAETYKASQTITITGDQTTTTTGKIYLN